MNFSVLKISHVLSYLSLLLFLAFSFFGHYDSDDFYIINELNKISIWKYAIDGYLNWDGRSLSLPAIVQLTALKWFKPQAIVFVWNLFFWATLSVFYFLLQQKHPTYKKNLPTMVSLLFVFWLGNYTNIADTLYWCTGGVYTVSLFLIFAWIFLFERTPDRRKPTLIFILYTFVVALSSLQIVLIQISYLLIMMLFYRQKLNGRYLLLWLLIGVGFLLTTFAPGNFNRVTFSPNGFDFNLPHLVKNTVVLYGKFIMYGILLFVLSAVWALIIGGGKFIISKDNFKDVRTSLHKFRWLLIGLFSALPLIVMPDFVGHRPSIFFLWFVALFVIDVFSIRVDNLHFSKRIIAVLVIFIGVLSFQLVQNHSFHKSIKTRENYLFAMNKHDSVIVMPEIETAMIPFTYKYQPVLNKSFAVYYGYDWIYANPEAKQPKYFRTIMNEKLHEILSRKADRKK